MKRRALVLIIVFAMAGVGSVTMAVNQVDYRSLPDMGNTSIAGKLNRVLYGRLRSS